MFRLGNVVGYFTDPGSDMLLGLEYQSSEAFDELGNKVMDADIFSIGLFFYRIDIFLNMQNAE